MEHGHGPEKSLAATDSELISAFQRSGDRPALEALVPAGVDAEAQRASIAAINDLNGMHLSEMRDPELAARIGAYELAFRMQAAAPELTDLSGESQITLDDYGLDR
jgi:hypothetical protein